MTTPAKFKLEYIETPVLEYTKPPITETKTEPPSFLGLSREINGVSYEVKIPTTREVARKFRPYLGREFKLNLSFALDTNGPIPVERDGTYVEGVDHDEKLPA